MAITFEKIVSEPSPVRWLATVFQIGGIVAVLTGLVFGLHSSIPLIIWGISVVLSMSVQRRLSLDPASRVVTEEFLLYSVRVLMRKEWGLAEFEGINYSNGCVQEKVSVGLRHSSGRVFWLRDFSSIDGRPDRIAETFAWRLHCDLGLEIDNRVRKKC